MSSKEIEFSIGNLDVDGYEVAANILRRLYREREALDVRLESSQGALGDVVREHADTVAELATANGLVKSLEWTREPYAAACKGYVDYCRICGNHKIAGHLDDCRLAAHLKDATGEESKSTANDAKVSNRDDPASERCEQCKGVGVLHNPDYTPCPTCCGTGKATPKDGGEA